MIKIQVLGHGLIPRGNGLAPKKEPMEADLDLIKLMLNSGSLKLRAVNPNTGGTIPISFKNVDRIYKAFDGVVKKVETPKPVTRPSIPEKKPEAKKPEPETPKKVELNDHIATVETVTVPTTPNDVSSYTDNKGGKKDKDKGTLKVLNNPNA